MRRGRRGSSGVEVTKSSREPRPGVILRKGSKADTLLMNHDPRPHIHRRRRAISRLRSLTTGAAVAGLAGTAGFGVLAAATWSGSATAAGATIGSPTNGSANGTTGTARSPGTSGTSGTDRTRIVPNSGGTAQQPATPRVQRGTGTGHASTGGSN